VMNKTCTQCGRLAQYHIPKIYCHSCWAVWWCGLLEPLSGQVPSAEMWLDALNRASLEETEDE